MLASADPATKPLLADARPTLSGDTLVLSYPPTKSFLRQRAEAKRERIEALADKAYGRKIVIQFSELDPDTALAMALVLAATLLSLRRSAKGR